MARNLYPDRVKHAPLGAACATAAEQAEQPEDTVAARLTFTEAQTG